MPKYDFTTKEAALLSGVPFQTLDRWLKDGVVTCDVPSEGIGSRRRFTYRDVVLVIVARTLKDAMLTIPSIRTLVATIRASWRDDDPAHAGYLVFETWNDSVIAWWVADFRSALLLMPRRPDPRPRDSTWTGILSVLDVGYLASRALAHIEEGIREGKAKPIVYRDLQSPSSGLAVSIQESPGKTEIVLDIPTPQGE